MTLLIKNGRIIRDAAIESGSIIVCDGKIKGVGKVSPTRNVSVVDAKGFFVSPGFIDSHVHGDPAKVLEHEIKFGTTAIVPSISCASSKDIVRSVNFIKSFIRKDPFGRSVLGVRLEGPYISKERAGAQDKRFIRPPSEAGMRAMIKKCGPILKIVTLAPELEGANELIHILRANKIIASMGHSDANYRKSIAAIKAGATHATHLFNGMRRMSPADAGVAGASLIDKRVVVEIIFDMIHVRPALLYLTLTMKNRDSIILVTDSVRAQPRPGKVEGGVYRLKDGTIAGSRLTMISAVKNAVQHCGVNIKDAVRFASMNPARLLGVDASKGSIEKRKDADIVIFDKNFDVKMTIVRGRIAYRKRGF